MKIFVLIMLMFSFVFSDKLVITKVNRVYDGDTFYVDLDCDKSIFCENLPIRLYGVDTPEIRGSTSREKTFAYMAKKEVIEFFKEHDIVELKNCIRGKYFRLVCEVYGNKESLSRRLLEKQLAVPYFGDTKTYNWDLHQIKE